MDCPFLLVNDRRLIAAVGKLEIWHKAAVAVAVARKAAAAHWYHAAVDGAAVRFYYKKQVGSFLDRVDAVTGVDTVVHCVSVAACEVAYPADISVLCKGGGVHGAVAVVGAVIAYAADKDTPEVCRGSALRRG